MAAANLMEHGDEWVYPCVLRIVKGAYFNDKDPIILGVEVVEGIAKVGTPICIPSRNFICIGRIASIINDHKLVNNALESRTVAVVTIIGDNAEEKQKMFGTDFNEEDELVSCISRTSLDTFKANYPDHMPIGDVMLFMKLKARLKIQ